MTQSYSTRQDPDEHIRAAAFAAIGKISRQFGGLVPWSKLKDGFRAGDQRILFANQVTGIFKPKQMSAALSIKTVVPRKGRHVWYDDQLTSTTLDYTTGLLRYNLTRRPDNPTNLALREAWRRRAALIYLDGIKPSLYQPIFPVWIKQFLPEEGYVLLTDNLAIQEDRGVSIEKEGIEPSYSLRMIHSRNHQAWFSKSTKEAYQWKCAFSGLPVRALLVGAHIVPDAEGGPPLVQNGICMSALHHVAFDSHLVGVDPDRRIRVSPRLRNEQDGELLQALKELDGTALRLPKDRDLWPRREFLEQRFARFQEAAG